MADADVVVVGSGFGGAVMACRLAQQGRRVLVLERGRRWQVADYPAQSGRNWFWREGNPERHHGWLDLRLFGDMSVAAGCGVGGGSLVYANVCIDAHPEAFAQGWPPEITHAALRPFYARVSAMLQPAHLPPGQWTRRTQLLQEAAARLGEPGRFRTVPQAIRFDPDWHAGLDDAHAPARARVAPNALGLPQGTCVHCGNCDIGCPVQAKNTLDLNYIPLAERHGAEVRPLHHVRGIVPEGGGYRVRFRDLGRRRDGSVLARQVVLAAGSIGSTQLLLQCRDRDRTLGRLSPLLGKRWSANGDFVTPAWYPQRRLSPTRGPTISACIDYLDGGGAAGGQPLFIEDGGFPDLLATLLQEYGRHWPGRRQLRRAGLGPLLQAVRNRDPLLHLMPWFGQGRDASNGELYLGRPWYAPWRRDVLKMRWDWRPNAAVMQALSDLHVRLSRATGGMPLTPPTWTLLRNLVTPHPLGGCVMGQGPGDGVVDHRGEVFGHPGLFVVDGAVVPVSLGLNPSKTIAALAERAATLLPG